MIFGEIKRFFDIEIVKITEKLEFKRSDKRNM